MSDWFQQSLAFSERLIAVRYHGADKALLRDECADWLKRAPSYESETRAAYKGNRMLPNQLDLLDKAKDRVRAVWINCR